MNDAFSDDLTSIWRLRYFGENVPAWRRRGCVLYRGEHPEMGTLLHGAARLLATARQ